MSDYEPTPSPQPEPTGLVERVATGLMVEEHCDARQALDPERQWETRFSPEDREEYRALARRAALAVADWLDEQPYYQAHAFASLVRREAGEPS